MRCRSFHRSRGGRECGVRQAECGLRSAEGDGQFSVANGQWPAADGRRREGGGWGELEMGNGKVGMALRNEEAIEDYFCADR